MALTYNGATAGTTLANPLRMVGDGIAARFEYATSGVSTNQFSNRIWTWASTSDITDVTALNAFNDGKTLGARPGDILFMVSGTEGSTTPKLQMGVFAFPATAATTGICLSSNVLSSTNA